MKGFTVSRSEERECRRDIAGDVYMEVGENLEEVEHWEIGKDRI